MGSSESFLGVDKEDYTNILLAYFVNILAYYGAFQPIWHRHTWRSEYGREKNKYKRWLLNPRVWYDNLIWFVLFFFASISLYRFLRILRVSGDSGRIFNAEIGIWLYTAQIGFHGTWAVSHFYWKQPLWSICNMGTAAAFSVGVWVVAILVDPVYSAISYAPFVVAHFVFVGCNCYLYMKSRDSQRRTEYPLTLYWKHGLYPIEMKKNVATL